MKDNYILYSDGSYTPGLDYAGIGGYLTKNDKIIEKFSIITHEQPEYFEIAALYEGLLLAKKNGITDLVCKGDDIKLFRICNTPGIRVRQYYHKSYLFPKILELIKTFDNISFEYLPRTKNKLADRLAGKYKTKLLENEENKNILGLLNGSVAKKDLKGKRIAPIVEHHVTFKISSHPNNTFLFEITHIDKKTNNKDYVKKIIKNNNKSLFSSISECLNKLEGNISFYIEGKKANDILNIFSINLNPDIIKISKQVNILVESLSKFESWTIYNDPQAMDATSTIKKNPHLTEEELIESIKILGDDSYKIGDRLDLETFFNISENKKDDIVAIQKKFFSCFVDIGFKSFNQFKILNSHERNTIIEERKEMLRQHNAKLKF